MSTGAETAIDVTIVMPCLNEARALATCILGARQALARLRDRHGLEGEIIVADNGSSDCRWTTPKAS